MQILERNNSFIFVFSYNPRLVSAVKAIPGIHWDWQNKWWVLPNVNGNRQKAENFAQRYGFQFAGQTVEKPFDKPLPDMPKLQLTNEQLKQYLKLTPYPYQLDGIAYCIEHKRAIIGDQPGLGKTAEAIAAVTIANQFPCLVICPSSLKENWKREWQMWTNKRVSILNNANQHTWHLFAKGQSLFGQKDEGMTQVFITNYESLKKYFVKSINKSSKLTLKDIQFSEHIRLFKSVIIDESHRVKEIKTLQTKLTKGICMNKEYVFALTGTPVVNKPIDLVSQLGIIDQLGKFGGYKAFLSNYCAGFDKGHSNLKELNWMLHTHCFFRREKKDVLKDLPDKVRQVVYCDIINRREYNDALADLEIYLKKYRQATDEQIARSMKGEVMVRIGVLKNISARGKLNDVTEYISDIVESGEKIIVFIHLKEVAQHLKKMFPAAVTITGEDNNIQRQRAVDSFQNDPDTQVIICSIKAAGVGLTLTASSRVAFVELPWHPADTEQCEDRCIVEGQPILTPKGWIPIENIKKGDLIINRFGETALVKDAWSKGNTKLVTEIKVEGWGVIKTTNDHRFLTVNGWKEASALLPGDKIVMPKQTSDNINYLKSIPFDGDCRINRTFIGNHGQKIENGRLIHAPETVNITDDTLFVFGYFVGDGFASTMKGKGRFISIAGHTVKKREALERCKKWFDSIGLNYSERAEVNGLGTEIRAYSGEWALFFEKHFGIKAHGKQLPEYLMYLNPEQSKSILSGLMASDGYFRKNRYEYVTASDKLASQVARLILRAGYRPTVTTNSTEQHVIAYSESQTDNNAMVQSVFTYFPKKINGERQRVYDLTTDITESFVVGLSVVHNCHRIGQKESVQATYFLGRDTIDEWVYQIIDEKRSISSQITGARNEVEVSVMDSVINLFNKKIK